MQVSEIRKLLQEAQAAYQKNTSATAQAYKELSKSDAEISATIATKAEVQRDLADALSHWRSRALATAREWSARNCGIAAERASEHPASHSPIQIQASKYLGLG